jgi:hypothetical protein
MSVNLRQGARSQLNVCYVTFWAQALRPYVSLESLTVGAHGVRPLFDNMNSSYLPLFLFESKFKLDCELFLL